MTNVVSQEETDKKDWRDRKTADQCLAHMCLSEYLSDVSFTFASHPNVKLPAHKFALSMRSSVFEAMFYGPMGESGNSIRLDDIDPEIMKNLLRFIYTDRPELNGNNVLPCLYAAKKYALVGFEDQCSTFLDTSITCENVCSIHEQAVFYGMQQLQTRCFQFILENAYGVLKSDDFVEINESTMLQIIQNDSLLTDELGVFHACMKWSEHQCKQKNLEPTVENKRAALGDVLFHIRFPVMPVEQFSKFVSPSGILSSDEQVMIFQYLVSKTPIPGNRFACGERMWSFIVKNENLRDSRFQGMALRMKYAKGQKLVPPVLKLAAVVGTFVTKIKKVTTKRDGQTHSFCLNGNVLKFDKSFEIWDGTDVVFESGESVSWPVMPGMLSVGTSREINMKQVIAGRVIDMPGMLSVGTSREINMKQAIAGRVIDICYIPEGTVSIYVSL